MIRSNWILEGIGKNFRQYFNVKNPKQHKIIVKAALNSLDPTFYVGASEDDAYEIDTGLGFSYTAAFTLVYSASSPTISQYAPGGFRFPNVTIPQGATIQNAYFKGYIYSASWDDLDTDIYGNNVDNAQNFVDNQHIIDQGYRPRTGAYVSWIQHNYGTGWKTSPDISSVIQEIVNRSGWSSGNALVLLFIPHITGSQWPCRFYSYDQDPSYAPQLEVTWTAGGVVKEVADFVALGDSVLRNRAFAVADSVGLADASLKHWTPQIVDSLGLSDTILRGKQFSVSDSISLSELVTVLTEIIKQVTDSLCLSDAVGLDKALLLADEIQLADNVYVNKILIVSDDVALVEVVEKSVQGVVKTRVFLIIGDLAIQLTGD